MADNVQSYVNWEELENLRTKLNNIADKLSDLRENVSNAISGVGERWQDAKYDEFANAYEPYKNEIEKISEEYLNYANVVLPPIIEHGKAYDPIKMS
jgi:uncharacterized protein YukE